MPFNLIKTYPDLLELDHLKENDRKKSLRKIFKRDFEDVGNSFNNKTIRPVPSEKDNMELLFTHLTTRKDYIDNDYKRVYDRDRSVRLHWIRPHLLQKIKDDIEVFSVQEKIRRRYDIRTYIYNRTEQYVIILEPFRNTKDYYLITAYYLESRNTRKIERKLSRKLPEVH